MKTKTKYSVLLFVLIGAALAIGGCEATYTPGPYYGGGPYYGRGPYYGGNYPASVAIDVGDRPYYVRGPGYYVGRTYYVWKPGHWRSRDGQRVWIHGRYVVRGGY
jgi:hypothetical protein